MLNINSVISKKEDAVMAELDGKVVIMSIENGQYYGLDEIGTDIWKRIEGTVTVKSIVEQLVQEYEVSEERCIEELITFLQSIDSKGLIKIV